MSGTLTFIPASGGNSPPEAWTFVPGFEGRYLVSTFGRVKSLPKRSRACVRLLRPSRSLRGYLTVILCRDGGKRRYWVHQLVLLAFVGPKPSPIHQTRHLNGIKSDNHLDNLAWGTPGENGEDNAYHGILKGERSGHARLTAEAVRGIVEDLLSGMTINRTAIKYGISAGAVTGIMGGRNWTHIVDAATVAKLRNRPKQVAKGSRHPRAKLSEEQIMLIRNSTGTQRSLARLFGVSHNTIGHIKRGATWSHVA